MNIKVRAWDKQKQKYHYPKLWDNSMPSNWEQFYELELFTGLTDVNGKEIFEGDILDDEESYNYVVYYESDYCGFFITRQDGFNERLPLYDFLLPKVIGNIHENPELL